MYDPTNSRYRYLRLRENEVYRRFIRDDNESHDPKDKFSAHDIPAHGTYGSLLFRTEWKTKRTEIINRDKCCVICKGSNGLQVHHRQYHFVVRENRYKSPWEYPGNLLITLCESCHNRGHNKFKVPTINI